MDPNTQPPSVDTDSVVPEGTETYVAPAEDSHAAEVGEKTGAETQWINPEQVKPLAQAAVNAGGKAWLWWTVAGVTTTVVLLLGVNYYFYRVKGTDVTSNKTTGNTAQGTTNSTQNVSLPYTFKKNRSSLC